MTCVSVGAATTVKPPMSKKEEDFFKSQDRKRQRGDNMIAFGATMVFMFFILAIAFLIFWLCRR